MSQGKPWWKEPWPWLLISGPAIAMIGCAVTIWVAMQHADRPIVDGVVRQGLVIRQAATPAAAMAAAAAVATPGATAGAKQHARDAGNPQSAARP